MSVKGNNQSNRLEYSAICNGLSNSTGVVAAAGVAVRGSPVALSADSNHRPPESPTKADQRSIGTVPDDVRADRRRPAF